jgi:hypothetical protein
MVPEVNFYQKLFDSAYEWKKLNWYEVIFKVINYYSVMLIQVNNDIFEEWT